MKMQMTRKEFILGTGAFLGAGAMAADAERPLVRFGVVTDVHYADRAQTGNVDYRGALAKLQDAVARLEGRGLEFVIELGDFKDDSGSASATLAKLDEIEAAFTAFSGGHYHVMGNHDTDYSSLAETMAAFRMEKLHYYFDMGGFRFVVCDPNYTIVDGRYVHHEWGNYFKWVKSMPFIVMPPEQLEWLFDTLRSSPYPCVVFSHEGFERPRYSEGVWNKDAVQAIFHEVNARWPRRVLMAACGHYHVGNMSLIDNIPYWEVNGANFFSCGRNHKCYPPEYAAKHIACGHNIAWAEPLSAVVSLYPNGRIKIDGMKTDYLFGVTCEMAGFPNHDDCGRFAKPEIESADFIMRQQS